MKKSLIIVIIIVALVLVFGLYVYFKNKSAVMVSGGMDMGTGGNLPYQKPAPTAPANDNWPLQNGSKGDKVKLLQVFAGVTPDGVFGVKTEAAAKVKFGKTTIDKNDLFAVINPLTQVGGLLVEKTANMQGNYFPLSTGTTGYFTRLFQLAAGLTIDGKFGSQSAAAAKKIFGTETVSQAQLQALLANKFFDGSFPLNKSTGTGVKSILDTLNGLI